MNLSYTLPNAKELILNGTKIHTARYSHRWKAGMAIHHCTGLRTKNYECFLVNKCTGTQIIDIVIDPTGAFPYVQDIEIDGRKLSREEIDRFRINDGFENERDLCTFFKKKVLPHMLIHWTDFRY